MPRVMRGDESAAFRAVITTTYPSGNTSTSYRGPFGTKGAARAAITRAERAAEHARRYWREDRTVTGHVETSSTIWTKLED